MNLWRQDISNCASVEPLGVFRGKAAPPELHGMLGALLIRSMDIGQDVEEGLSRIGIDLPDRPFRIVIFALDDCKLEELNRAERHNCCIGLYSDIRTRLMETLDGTADGFLSLMFGYLIGILYPAGVSDHIGSGCRDAIGYAKNQLAVSCHVSVSAPWRGSENIEQAYKMVRDVEYSRKFYGEKVARVFIASERDLLRLQDKEQQTQFEQTFFSTAQRVSGMVRAGDAAAAGAELREQLLKIAEHCVGLPYPNTLNLTVNRFITLLQSRLTEEDLADWRYLHRLDFSRELISCPSLTEYLAVGDHIAERLVRHARDRMESKHNALMRDIRAYLEENATDVNIGLTAVARNFHIPPREAAESFRAYYGISINDVIHQTRVKRAKELLLTTNDPVQSIAEQVGYCSLATMYRAFSNIEGVAPGKLRQNSGHSH